MEGKSGLQIIHDAIESSQRVSEIADGRLDDSVLIGWTVVAEWTGVNGRRTLTRASGNASGETPPTWQTNGYLFEALHGSWNESGDD